MMTIISPRKWVHIIHHINALVMKIFKDHNLLVFLQASSNVILHSITNELNYIYESS